MIAHTTLPVSDYKRAKAFCVKILQPLGYSNNMEFGESAGFNVSICCCGIGTGIVIPCSVTSLQFARRAESQVVAEVIHGPHDVSHCAYGLRM
jgi:hypothetical protein